jgi:hypothetical protein
MNFSGDKSYSRAKSNDKENIEQEAPPGAKTSVVEEHGIASGGER